MRALEMGISGDSKEDGLKKYETCETKIFRSTASHH